MYNTAARLPEKFPVACDLYRVEGQRIGAIHAKDKDDFINRAHALLITHQLSDDVPAGTVSVVYVDPDGDLVIQDRRPMDYPVLYSRTKADGEGRVAG